MLTVAKGFSEQQKKTFSNQLKNECKLSWQRFGYKKTSIDDLCKHVGISKGAFYIFFPTKEALFYQTFRDIQDYLYEVVENKLVEMPNKYGVAAALKEIFRVYHESPFIYEHKNPDFLAFFNKLEEEQRIDLSEKTYISTKYMLNKPFLSLKIEEDLAISILSAMLNTITENSTLSNPIDVFDFMVDHLIDEIFD
ncbi:putative transcriptional regulator [Bacillus sp. TS-2]|nr:putative transcriptional regulator [Bacillus sp. TS-2]